MTIAKSLIIKSILLLATLFIFGFVAAEAQAACSISTAEFRTVNAVNLDSFFNNENPPYVYVDITTNEECIGTTIQLSITADYEVFGVDTETDVTAVNNEEIQIPNDDFTVALISGNDWCDTAYAPDCTYHIETWDATSGFGVGDDTEYGQIQYNCYDDSCNSPLVFWEYVGLIEFETTHANDPANINNPDGTDTTNPDGTDTTNPDGTDTASTFYQFETPLSDIPSIYSLIADLLSILIRIGIPVLVLAIVYSGFLFVKSRGNPEGLSEAKKVLLYTLIGGAILLGAWVLATAIQGTISAIIG